MLADTTCMYTTLFHTGVTTANRLFSLSPSLNRRGLPRATLHAKRGASTSGGREVHRAALLEKHEGAWLGAVLRRPLFPGG